MINREKVVRLLFLIPCVGLIVLASIFFYRIGSELFLQWKFSQCMQGYFAIEIRNETQNDYIVTLFDNDNDEFRETTWVDAMNRLTLVSYPSGNAYQLTFIDSEQREIGKEIYVSSLPSHSYQIRLCNEREIEMKIAKMDRSTLESYQKIMEKKY